MAIQTAAQQLINYMEANFHLTDESRIQFEKTLEAEKQQIIDAYAQGFIESETMDKGAVQYYNENYNPEKP